MKFGFFLYKNKIWKCVAWFMTIFCASACVVLTYFFGSTLYVVIRDGFSEVVAIYVAPTVSYTSFVVSFLALACQLKKLRKLLRDISKEINVTNAAIEKRLMLKLILSLSAVFVFICCAISNTIQQITLFFKDYYDSNGLSVMCFGCNVTIWNIDLLKFYVYTMSALYGSSVIAISCFQIILYCFLSMALADITKQTVANFSSERCSLQNLISLRRRFHRIRKLVDRLNELFKNVVLFWLGSSLLSTCRNVTEFVSYLLMPSSLVVDERNIFFWISRLLDLVLLVSLIWVASRLPEECGKIYNYLPNVSDGSDSKGSREVMIFYQELANHKLTLQAGSCFVITKNLLLSFFGLAVTYTIVFIQFKPHLLKTLSETGSNSSNT